MLIVESRLELSRFITPKNISDHRTAPVISLGYLRIMFTVDNIDELVSRFTMHGAQLVARSFSTRTPIDFTTFVDLLEASPCQQACN
jgi:hypothetical protein